MTTGHSRQAGCAGPRPQAINARLAFDSGCLGQQARLEGPHALAEGLLDVDGAAEAVFRCTEGEVDHRHLALLDRQRGAKARRRDERGGARAALSAAQTDPHGGTAQGRHQRHRAGLRGLPLRLGRVAPEQHGAGGAVEQTAPADRTTGLIGGAVVLGLLVWLGVTDIWNAVNPSDAANWPAAGLVPQGDVSEELFSELLRGRVAWVFDEDNYDIDLIVGVRNIKITDVKELASLAMADRDPNFAASVRPGDVLVVSYALAQIDAEALAQKSWATLVMDEAQATGEHSLRRVLGPVHLIMLGIGAGALTLAALIHFGGLALGNPLVFAFGGLLAMVLGYFIDQQEAQDAALFYNLGGLAVVGGVVMVFIRSRLRGE